MKKSERINDMISYLNDKGEFNLKDLADKYQISKRTALRDIQAVEELGLPIYSQHGRYGKYGVLKNKLLSPILFNMDEILTLYFSMLSLSSYQTTPFHIQADKLNTKFIKCLSQKQVAQILQLKKVLDIYSYDYQSPCDCLNDILDSILETNALNIIYQINDNHKKYNLQFFRISARFGQWYANAYDLNESKLKVFRCDKIRILGNSDDVCDSTIEELLEKYNHMENYTSVTYFNVTVDERGKDIFYKENYKNMTLEIGDTISIKGSFNYNELDFITNYFINFGTSIISIQPEELRDSMYRKLTQLKKHIKNL